MPLQVVETTGLKNDGPIGVKLEDRRFILVADRAHFSIDKADRYATTKQDFVIRLKENIQLNRKKSLKRTAVAGSNIVADFTCTLGTAQKQTKKRHRVVEFIDYEGAHVRAVTNLRNVTAEDIAGMYKERWAIESFFRWIKQNLNVPVLFGTTKNAVFSQLFAALIAYVLLKFLHTEGQKKIAVNVYPSLVLRTNFFVLPCQSSGGFALGKYSRFIGNFTKEILDEFS